MVMGRHKLQRVGSIHYCTKINNYDNIIPRSSNLYALLYSPFTRKKRKNNLKERYIKVRKPNNAE